jgi:hypothetical protein
LNAFAAQAAGYDYVVLSNELFANLYDRNRDGLRFILGHELGPHPPAPCLGLAVVPDGGRLLAVDPAARAGVVPAAGVLLRSARRLVVAAGGQGLVLLASGRYTETEVDLDELVRQGRQLRGF